MSEVPEAAAGKGPEWTEAAQVADRGRVQGRDQKAAGRRGWEQDKDPKAPGRRGWEQGRNQKAVEAPIDRGQKKVKSKK